MTEIKKGRGRPKKIVEEEPVKEVKKGRGRPKKIVVDIQPLEDPIKELKKIGRPVKGDGKPLWDEEKIKDYHKEYYQQNKEKYKKACNMNREKTKINKLEKQLSELITHQQMTQELKKSITCLLNFLKKKIE